MNENNETNATEPVAPDLLELGDVSVETRGGVLGHFLDGGFGFKIH